MSLPGLIISGTANLSLDRTSGISYCLVGPGLSPDAPPTSVHLHARGVEMQPTTLGINIESWTGARAVTKYLDCLWADASYRIRTQLAGRNIPFPSDEDVFFMFTTPAVWSEETVSRMRKSIEESTILHPGASLGHIDEPEAAALAVIPGAVTKRSLKEGQTVVIADLGGGTVDFISYTINTLTPLTVRECVPGEGRLLGDMFMRRALLSLAILKIESVLGVKVQADDLGFVEAEVGNVWEETLSEPAATLSNITYALKFKLQDGTDLRVALEGSEIVKVYQEITNGIIQLAKKQMVAVKSTTRADPAVVLVVGGFGLNEFLKAEMQSDPMLGPYVEFTGERGQLAVKNGAAIACATTFGGNANIPTPAIPHPLGIPHAPIAAMRVVSHLWPQSYGYWDGVRHRDEITWFIRKVCSPFSISVTPWVTPAPG
ncbi:hypothetical protein F5144DRAFT_533690 [Chaetomium tenue]|uniref:Uncharacterized protein n=1 Tax=Chaetomium tenue TaxID=1854479 RepID=A0ACB7P8G5_9PEZI|nr:hypothetical protein F5144DRAFT_533690 [Chaetomium globosum]